jgi:hypothetical protein
MDYRASLIGKRQRPDAWVRVVVPSPARVPVRRRLERGAHNQRSHVTIAAKLREHMWIEELIEIAESEASCELYGILKRPDEKYVTERAYDNPKFVEDMVRDVAVRLNDEPRVAAYVVESENFESIHNHSAYAQIERDKDATSKPHSSKHVEKRMAQAVPPATGVTLCEAHGARESARELVSVSAPPGVECSRYDQFWSETSRRDQKSPFRWMMRPRSHASLVL